MMASQKVRPTALRRFFRTSTYLVYAFKGPSGAEKNSNKKEALEASKKKRRFPFRKVAELEGEILERETRIDELNHSLADPELHRSGKVKEVKAEIAEQQAALKALYEHWEEAVELN
jgi:ATP-binding cassette subfamily F protein 3